MSIIDKELLLSYFESGDKPSQSQFRDLIDSCYRDNESNFLGFLTSPPISVTVTPAWCLVGSEASNITLYTIDKGSLVWVKRGTTDFSKDFKLFFGTESNFEGIFHSVAEATIEKAPAWCLVGEDISALKAYVFPLGGSDWVLFSDTEFDFTDFGRFSEKIDELDAKAITVQVVSNLESIL